MRKYGVISAFTLAVAGIWPSTSISASHTWFPGATAQATTGSANQSVTIIGQQIVWGIGGFDVGFPDSSMDMTSPGTVSSFTLTMLDFQAKITLIKLARTCDNPFLTAEQKLTTSQSDPIIRWLTASSMANMVVVRSMYWYDRAIPPISIIIGNQSFKGFKVWYKDGFSETWIFTPNYTLSSIKLFDTPAPNSLKSDGPGC